MSSAAERIGSAFSPRFGRIVRLFADPVSALGLAIVLLIVLCALFAPLIAPYDPAHIDVTEKLRPPSPAHWFGTDQLGRDLLSRIVYGARTALSIAFVSTLLAGTVGLLLGMIAGYGPRWLDGLMVLLFDSMNALPMIMFALAVITVLGGGTATLILVIVLTSMPAYARLVRAQTLALKNSEFIIAERSLGAGPVRIILVHLLPNVVGPLAILLSMDVPVIIMVEAGLSFLGLGVRPPTPSWGSILYDSYANLRRAPSMVVFGGLPLVLATLGFTFLGEALRDALDPRLQFRRSL
ncbi:MAG TPA: ABC transporter permease [Aestuariivirgaceae bacterium]|nr:ABC transporter permease [Aestuariivirgaceae bacterium]